MSNDSDSLQQKEARSGFPVFLPPLAKGRKKLWSFVSLVFSLFYFFPSFIFETDHHNMSWVALGYIAFLFVYVKALLSKLPHAYSYVLVLLSLVFITSFLTFGGLFLFAYVAFLVGYYLPVTGSINFRKTSAKSRYVFFRSSGELAICICLLITLRWYWQPEYSYWLTGVARPWQLISLFPVYAASIMLFTFGCLERKETLYGIAQQRSNMEIEQISTIAERERISRDLHDVVGHSLTSISIKADLASQLLTRDKIQDAQRQIDEVAVIAREILSDVRKALSNIKQRGFLDEVKIAKSVLMDKGIVCQIDVKQSDVDRLHSKVEAHLTLILKELITNIMRHSNANHVQISILISKSDLFTLKVMDNGTCVEKFSIDNQINGQGLKGIKERCKAIGADLDFDFIQGFSCIIRFPLLLQPKDST